MSEPVTHALVLTAPEGAGAIDDAIVADIARSDFDRGMVSSTRTLAPRAAWEALFALPPEQDLLDLRTRIADRTRGRPIDVNIVPAAPTIRRKKLLVADLESTIIQEECLDELADYVGLRPRIADITARAMRGELDFETALKERVSLLKGLDAGVLAEIHGRVTLMPGAQSLVATMKAHGATCALVSGGFTYFTERIADRLGFDLQRGNTLELAGGRLTGTVGEPILGREAKLATLERLARDRGLDSALTLAVGDGANDLAMIRAAGLGVAFRAKPIVAAEATASITHGDLTALLYLQGYTRAEFA